MIQKLKSVRERIEPCSPPVWAMGGHLQTILGHLVPSEVDESDGETHLIGLESESEKLHATLYRGESKTLVSVFHGLGSDTETDYIRRTSLLAQKLGHNVLLVNHRGCGKGKGLAKESYHSGRAEDLSAAIAYGRKLFPEYTHVAVGFSLSANALLLLAAKYRGEVQPDVAIAVNGPIHLDHCSLRLKTGLNRIYDYRFLLQLKSYIRENRPEMKKGLKARTLREFDEYYTAPSGGFKDHLHYYETCSALPHLKNISIPTVMLSALDDPFVVGADYEKAEISPLVHLHLEKHGGHMGYLSKQGFGFYRWMDHAIESYLKAIHD